MTRKDYELLASALRAAMHASEQQTVLSRVAHTAGVRTAAQAVADALHLDNPRLRPTVFMAAAGINS